LLQFIILSGSASLFPTEHPKQLYMRGFIIVFLTVLFIPSYAQFSKWFEDKTLRMDYFHNGNHKEEIYSFDELLEEPFWGGSKTQLIDTFEYGNYLFKVFDETSKQLLYSRGYSTLFLNGRQLTRLIPCGDLFRKVLSFLFLKTRW